VQLASAFFKAVLLPSCQTTARISQQAVGNRSIPHHFASSCLPSRGVRLSTASVVESPWTRTLDRDLDYEIVFDKATSAKPLVVTVNAGLPARHVGRLPNQTTVLLLFDTTGRPLLQYTYGIRQNQENLPPEKQ
jgi:hypothetical protein